MQTVRCLRRAHRLTSKRLRAIWWQPELPAPGKSQAGTEHTPRSGRRNYLQGDRGPGGRRAGTNRGQRPACGLQHDGDVHDKGEFLWALREGIREVRGVGEQAGLEGNPCFSMSP